VEIHSTEEQQVEAIKKWWKENMWSLIGGVAIGIAALVGGRAWVDGQNAYMEAASSEYLNLQEKMTSGKNDEASVHGAQLLGQYSDTPYASLAAMAMAKIKMDAGDLLAASSHLRWALDNASQDAVKHEARLRLSRILLADKKSAEALTLLDVPDAGNYTSAYEQLKGDIYVADGKPESARTAYSRALKQLSPTASDRNSLQMKLDDLGSVNVVKSAEVIS
jgi:predicted negative regulator of RcsB-dependent stress response